MRIDVHLKKIRMAITNCYRKVLHSWERIKENQDKNDWIARTTIEIEIEWKESIQSLGIDHLHCHSLMQGKLMTSARVQLQSCQRQMRLSNSEHNCRSSSGLCRSGSPVLLWQGIFNIEFQKCFQNLSPPLTLAAQPSAGQSEIGCQSPAPVDISSTEVLATA